MTNLGVDGGSGDSDYLCGTHMSDPGWTREGVELVREQVMVFAKISV